MSFLEQLVNSKIDEFTRATQSPFLFSAARGTVPKDTLGEWLANDRLYIHAYIRGLGHLLSQLELPVVSTEARDSFATRLLDWSIEALANVRREEKFFVDTASKFGIRVDLPTSDDGIILKDAKLPGLEHFERLFGSIKIDQSRSIPWLEAAILFWGTEKCYLEAWSWAASQMQRGKDVSNDVDGGALRSEFIPNWSSTEFADFVDRLGRIIDDAVSEHLRNHDRESTELLSRAGVVWDVLLQAETAFWPSMD